MKRRINVSFLLGALTAAVALAVLGLYQPRTASTQEAPPPFGNSVEQRNEVVAQLKELNAQIKEQNALLRSGQLKVLVSLDKKQDSQ